MKIQISPPDTIAAISTPRGRGAIAIIRLSGAKSHQISKELWRAKKHTASMEFEPHRLYSGDVTIGGKLVDHGLIALSYGPRSYTGEDMAELHLHGSIALADAVLSSCMEHGARLAEPGEFTRRALLNSKLDVAQAEAVADLVDAESQALVRLAADQLAGGISTKISNLLERVVALSAAEAAYLDFSEEDIDASTATHLGERIAELQEECRLLLESSAHVTVLRDGLSVALIGLPNAGKSTLLNALVGFDRSIVTDIAGTTRDTIDERVILGDVPVRLIDTAGLNASPDEVEARGVERTVAAARAADLKLVLIAPGTVKDTLAYIEANNLTELLDPKRTIALLTKSDLKNGWGDNAAVPWTSSTIHLSATAGLGISELKQAIIDHATQGQSFEGTLLTTKRQIQIVKAAEQHLAQAQILLIQDAPRDIILVELEAAAQEFTHITGVDSNEAMLDDMFSQFCIGK